MLPQCGVSHCGMQFASWDEIAGRRFSQYFHFLLMSDIVSCRMLAAIANLIGERGEMAKQPLPVFIAVASRQSPACPHRSHLIAHSRRSRVFGSKNGSALV